MPKENKDGFAEMSQAEVEDNLIRLPAQINDEAQKVVNAEYNLNKAVDLLKGMEADTRIDHANEDLPAKILEAYCISDTKEQRDIVTTLKKDLELAKLVHQLLDNKYISCRKIANIHNHYQPL